MCPACRKGVSKEATACPQCGQPITPEALARGQAQLQHEAAGCGKGCGIALLIFLGLAVMGWIISAFQSCGRHDLSSGRSSTYSVSPCTRQMTYLLGQLPDDTPSDDPRVMLIMKNYQDCLRKHGQ